MVNESERGTNTFAVLGRFVCRALRFITHAPRKRHSFLLFTMLPTKTLTKILRKTLSIQNFPQFTLCVWIAQLPDYLLTVVIGNWTEKIKQGSTKEIWHHCKYFEKTLHTFRICTMKVFQQHICFLSLTCEKDRKISSSSDTPLSLYTCSVSLIWSAFQSW